MEAGKGLPVKEVDVLGLDDDQSVLEQENAAGGDPEDNPCSVE